MPDSYATYPADYRHTEAQAALRAVRAGACGLVLGLSGAGKSNFFRFLAQQCSTTEYPLCLVDSNRLSDWTPAAFWRLMARALTMSLGPEPEPTPPTDEAFEALEAAVLRRLTTPPSSPQVITFLLDLSPVLDREGQVLAGAGRALFSNLRALRDGQKFRVAYLLGARHPLPMQSELSELFDAHHIWLGPLSASDAAWNVRRFMARSNLTWDDATVAQLVEFSGRYPALLKAVCEAHAAGAELSEAALAPHPAVQRRRTEFWADAPTPEEIALAGLPHLPLLHWGRTPALDPALLTPKEHLLWHYLQAHLGEVCEKDALIHAIWPEDKVFEQGVRDDSLAQLVRRLRDKLDPDAAHPQKRLQTVPGRGYRLLG